MKRSRTRADEKKIEDRVVEKREFVAVEERAPEVSGEAPPRLALQPFSDYLIENEDM